MPTEPIDTKSDPAELRRFAELLAEARRLQDKVHHLSDGGVLFDLRELENKIDDGATWIRRNRVRAGAELGNLGELAAAMLAKQRRYHHHERTSTVLAASKRLEALVDQLVADVLNGQTLMTFTDAEAQS